MIVPTVDLGPVAAFPGRSSAVGDVGPVASPVRSSLAAQTTAAEIPPDSLKLGIVFGQRERPRSAAYTARRCRQVTPGSGGSPLPAAQLRQQRPVSASGTGSKTERWREAGEVRWPAPVTPNKLIEEPLADAVPFRQTIEYCQDNWKNELWMRSLRQPGLPIQDPVFATPGGDIKDMHEEWRDCTPMSPHAVPYCGATAYGQVAAKTEAVPARWVERPVATGKYSLGHMDGVRYEFNTSPRFYQDPSSPHYVGQSSTKAAQGPPGSSAPGKPPTSKGRRAGSGGVTQGRHWKARLCQR